MEEQNNPQPNNPTETPMSGSGTQQPVPQAPQGTPQPITLPEIGSAFSLFSPSVEALKLNLKPFLKVYGVIVALGIIVGLMSASESGANSGANLALGMITVALVVIIVILALILGPAVTYIQVQSAKGKKVTAKEALGTGKNFILRYIGLGIIAGFLIIGGFMLLIIPGLIMIRRYFLSPYLMIDKNVGILEAMRQSAALSKPHSGKIWGVIGVSFLMGLPSIIPVVGSIVGAILQLLYSFAPAIRYVQLDSASNPSTPIQNSVPPQPTVNTF